MLSVNRKIVEFDVTRTLVTEPTLVLSKYKIQSIF